MFPTISLKYWIMQTLAMCLTVWLIPKLTITSLVGPLMAVVALAFLNATVWDAALFFSVPNSLSMQALLLFLVNGLIFWVLVKVLPGIDVEGVLPAIFAPLVFTFCSLLIDHFGREVNWVEVFETLANILRDLKAYFQQPA